MNIRFPTHLLTIALVIAGCSSDELNGVARDEARTPPPGSEPGRPPPPPPRDPPEPPSGPEGGEPVPESPYAVGRIEAAFDVNATGAATYAIPIEVPPGIGGIEPKLAATYNSQAGDSALGVGFTLAGLPRVERCARTKVHDGAVGAVRLDDDDRFCTGGLRLLAISGDYGEPGTNYLTEMQTWSRFESTGSCRATVKLPASSAEEGQPWDQNTGAEATFSGPCTFQAELKNGSTAEFGGLEEMSSCNALVDSVEGQKAPRLDWPLTKLTDVHGNVMRVFYQDIGTTYCAPVRIEYGSNDDQQVPFDRVVEFEYTTHTERHNRYVGGARIVRDKALEHIRTYVKDGPNFDEVKHYEFQTGPLNLRDQLFVDRVKECSGAVCYPPTLVSWSDLDANATSMFSFSEYHSALDPQFGIRSPSLYGEGASGDFNCDGRQDFVYPVADYQIVTSPQSANLRVVKPFSVNAGNYEDTFGNPQDWGPRFHAGDFNADGCTDLIWLKHPLIDNAGGYEIFLGSAENGLSNTPAQTGGEISLADTIHIGDIDGDARADVLAIKNRELTETGDFALMFDFRVFLTTPTGFTLHQTGTLDDVPPAPAIPMLLDYEKYYGPVFTPGDFTGDGRVDFLVRFPFHASGGSDPQYGGHSRITLLVASQSGTLTKDWADVWPHPFYEILASDVNGDGRSDALVVGSARKGNTAPPSQAQSDLQENLLIFFGNGRTLTPRLTQTYQVQIDLAPNNWYFRDWGYTVGGIDWRHRLSPANITDDGRTDLVTGFNRRWDPSHETSDIQIHLSDGLGYVWQETIPKDPQDDYLAIDNGLEGMTGIFMRTDQLSGDPSYFYWTKSYKTGLATQFLDGLYGRFEVEYAPLTRSDVYTPGSGAIYPEREVTMPLFVVRKAEKNDAKDKLTSDRYAYAQARSHLAGHGFLGFGEVTVDRADGTTLTTTYRQDHPFAGFASSQHLDRNGVDLAQIDFTYVDVQHPSFADPNLHRVGLASQNRCEYILGSQNACISAVRSFSYDTFGNPVQMSDTPDSANPSALLITDTLYHNDLSAWRIGYPYEVKIHQGNPNVPLSHRKVTYDLPSRMNVLFEGSWDDTHQQWLGQEKTYDARGLVTSATSPLGTTEYEYDGFGHLALIINAIGQKIVKRVDPRFALEVERSDVSGNTVTIELDAFGRPLEILGPDENGNAAPFRRFVYTHPVEDEFLGLVTQTWNLRDHVGPEEWDWTETWTDVQGRVVRERRRGIGSSAIVRDREYFRDTLVLRTTEPYFEGSVPRWVESEYDVKSRPTAFVLHDGRRIETAYTDYDTSTHAMVMTRTEPNQSVTTVHVDFRDNLVKKVDATFATTTYAYDPLGRLTSVTSPDATTTTTYDTIGRKRSVADTDTGTTHFDYDVFGQLSLETDANGNQASRTYDALGRTLTKSFLAPNAATARTISYGYDDSSLTNGLGRLTSVVGPDHTYATSYDAYGRQSAAQLTIDGVAYTWSTRHDAMGNVVERSFPDGSIARYGFDSARFLEEIALWEPGDADGVFTPYAVYEDYDASGRVGQVTFGNDVVACYDFDVVTARMSRHRLTAHPSGVPSDPCAEEEEGENALLDLTYAWDDVDQITKITDQLGSDSQNFEYTPRGELAFAEGPYGLRSYVYSSGGSFLERTENNLITETYQYALGGHRPTSRSDGTAMSYDANGNLTQKTRGTDQWTYTWNEEDLLVQVVKNGQATSFVYDQDGHRLKKVEATGSTTYYVGSDYEVTVPASGPTRHTKYLQGPSGRVAQITRTEVMLVEQFESRQHEMLAAMFDPATLSGGPRVAWHTALAYVTSPAGRTAWRVTTVALPAVLCLLLLVGLRRRRRDMKLYGRPRFSPALAAAVAAVFFVTHGSGSASAAMSPGAHGVGEPAVGVRYLHQDQVGSTTVVTDENGNKSAHVNYTPYGEIHASSSGTDEFRPKFGGHELDRTTDLMFMQARYYDADLGRFISADRSIGSDPMQAVPHNRYAFGSNNPVTFQDPSGRFVGAIIAITVLVAGVVGFLVAGTEGKIFTDPANAFDDFNAAAAVAGAMIGVAVAVAAYAAGVLAAAVLGPTVFGVSTTAIAQTAVYGGAMSLAMSYAEGERDAGKLVLSFLGGFIAGFVATVSTSPDAGIKLANEIFGGVATSAVKTAMNPEQGFTLKIWAVTLTFGQGDPDVDFDFGFAFSKTMGLLGALNSGGIDKLGETALGQLKRIINPEDKTFADAIAVAVGPYDAKSLYGYVHAVSGKIDELSMADAPQAFGIKSLYEDASTKKFLKSLLEPTIQEVSGKDDFKLPL